MIKTHLFKGLFIAFILFQYNAYTQATQPKLKKMTFGVGLGFHSSHYKFENSDWSKNGLLDTITQLNIKGGLGFSLAIVADYAFSSALSLRVSPTFRFDESKLNIETKSDKNIVLNKESINLMVPLEMAYTIPNKKISPSFMAGVYYNYLLNVNNDNKKVQNERDLTMQRSTGGLKFGTGLSIPTSKFIFKPEFSYYHNLSNNLKSESLFSPLKTIESIRNHYWELRFIFVG